MEGERGRCVSNGGESADGGAGGLAAPSWYRPTAPARARFGPALDSFGRQFLRGDPPADALIATLAELPEAEGRRMVARALGGGLGGMPGAPRALVEFFRQIEEVPSWVDPARLDRGGRALLRSGFAGSLVLTTYALPLSYLSPDGVKPLVASGRMVQRASRRLTETGRFIVETCRPGGLARGGAGFAITVHVRLMHAQVRRLLLEDGWPTARWGVPINQAHMAGTNILFSALLVEGLRGIGYEMPAEDRADLMHLWRYSGLLSGVAPSLCAATEADALRLRDLLAAVTAPPDDDSRALVRALMESPLFTAKTPKEIAVARRTIDVMWAVSRHLLGEAYADALRYPRTSWWLAVPPIRAWNGIAGALGRYARGAGDPFYRVGLSSWERLIALGVAGIPVSFDFFGPTAAVPHAALPAR